MCGYGLLMSNVGDFAGRSSTGRPLKKKNIQKQATLGLRHVVSNKWCCKPTYHRRAAP